MKKNILTLILSFISLSIFAQEGYWQQHLTYNIDVTLNDTEKSLTGAETIVYKNNSPSTLEFIWFHIWPNAYKNETTALFQQLKNDPSRKKKLSKYTYGNLEDLSFKINGAAAKTEAHPNPQYIDIVKVLLPSPLKPGDSITINSDFKVKLPSYFSRSGYAETQFMVTQWHPKPAVFDKDGWHEFPYLDMGEFYSEYGDYRVNITLPAAYVLAATGVMQNAEELEIYKSIGARNSANKEGKPFLYEPKTGTKKISYAINNVPDFAWFADKDLVIQYDTVKLASGKMIDAFSYYHNKKKSLWVNSIDYIKDATRKYSEWIGEYEYPVVQAIEGPKNNSSGGMEYPTITLITSPDAKATSLDAIITHEVGHNWFMSMLGSNERMHTWQDEGLNTYFQFRYEAEKYKANSIFGDAIPAQVKELPTDKFQASIYNALSSIPMKSAIETPAANFSTSDEYGLISYMKTALWLYLLESAVGRDKIDLAFKTYFAQWKNKHPTPEDMKASFEKSLGSNLNQFFKMLHTEGQFK
ncbi:M1 family metallopeptidase [Pedobacter sp. HDW13]|uniref:M1 family metallopeptidase n=1 Tax=Pedobacter sp. HDW13 TaxID=2714940 RepID=UPI00140B8DA3|nr:M1 family metallopeptidase [Pedobacter sp. HDW13]QIL38599.1 M1 family metallopeptidase [Pedobacter sp. HDW13]